MHGDGGRNIPSVSVTQATGSEILDVFDLVCGGWVEWLARTTATGIVP